MNTLLIIYLCDSFICTRLRKYFHVSFMSSDFIIVMKNIQIGEIKKKRLFFFYPIPKLIVELNFSVI